MNKNRQFKILRLAFILVSISLGDCYASVARSYTGIAEYRIYNDMQQKRVTLQAVNRTLDQIMSELKKQTGIEYGFRNDVKIVNDPIFSLSVQNVSINEALTQLLASNKLQYKLVDGRIVIENAPVKSPKTTDRVVKGIVTDEKGNPIVGASVIVKGGTTGVSTNSKGEFSIKVKENDVLTVSCIGLKSQQVKVNGQSHLSVILQEDVTEVQDVLVNGYINMRKNSYTGSYTQISGADIKKVSQGNMITTLQVFDPSFRIISNNEMGSDPNTLPEFYVRGRSGLNTQNIGSTTDVSPYALKTNPNLPVFILDGFEVSAEKIYDLDINRIADITILKDAQATAIYGSRASNGVIVIQTVAPKSGQLTATYSYTMGVTMPDLTDYNLMNAQEKLQQEVASGLFDFGFPYDGYGYYEDRYDHFAKKSENISRGVDTYWLSKPLQTEINHKHSLYIEGGEKSVRFGFGLRLENQNGVMKESFRDKLGADFKLMYALKTKLNISNQVMIDHVKSRNSPYGNFSTYTSMMPYYPTNDLETGELEKSIPIALGGDYHAIVNPMWEAENTENYDGSQYLEFSDNLQFNYFPIKNLSIKGQFAVNYKMDKTRLFYDPKSTSELKRTKILNELGSLNLSSSNTTTWDAKVLANYSTNLGLNYVNVAFGAEFSEMISDYTANKYRGFPSGQLSEAKYARQADPASFYDDHTRTGGMFLNGNYSYDDIYLADFSIRFDGSSQFGTDKRYAPFISGGVGLNLHNYEFLKGSKIVDLARIRATFGQTGKVNYPPYAARSTYEMITEGWHLTGIGAYLYYMGNDRLKWETTNTVNVGMNVGLLHRINLEFNWYDRRTKDLITNVSTPPSSGFTSYKDNLGEVQNRGYEISMNVSVLSHKDLGVDVFFRAAHNQNKILKISESLKQYNDQVDAYLNNYRAWDSSPSSTYNNEFRKPALKYVEGGSEMSIFGMQSYGISPATGQEVYLNRDGRITYDWTSANQVIIGNTEPKLQGSFGLNLRWKRMTLYTTFLFETGGDVYNQTLVNSIENANYIHSNVDRRVYTQRWQKPGDVAPLKDIRDFLIATRPSSRFVQCKNEITVNSISLSYDFSRELLRYMGMQTLRLSFNMNDVGKFSNIRQERGLSYPFARSFNFSANVSF